jgi:hypothetical protein
MRRLAAATTAVLTAVALAACSGEDDSSPQPSAVRAPASSSAPATTPTTEAAPDGQLPTIAEYEATLAYAADLDGAAITKRPSGEERQGTAYAETTPGQTLRMTKPDGSQGSCSLGAVADSKGGPDPRVVDTLTPAMSRGRKVVFHHAPEDLLGAVQA